MTCQGTVCTNPATFAVTIRAKVDDWTEQLVERLYCDRCTALAHERKMSTVVHIQRLPVSADTHDD